MIDLVAEGWKDYELIDSGNGKRLERFGAYYTVRPDTACIWQPSDPGHLKWGAPDLAYNGKAGKGDWEGNKELLEGWRISWEQMTLNVVPTPFRHLALFPEQSAHWSWIVEKIAQSHGRLNRIRVLNLFAYTGAASCVAALAGAEVCHVDASRPSIQRAKENALTSSLSEHSIRWIHEDALKFMSREVRRGNAYDLILMDPPVFGRGNQGEIWRLEEGLSELATLAGALLSKDAVGFLLNFYATSLYPESVKRLVEDKISFPLELGALHIKETSSKKRLQTGYFLRS